MAKIPKRKRQSMKLYTLSLPKKPYDIRNPSLPPFTPSKHTPPKDSRTNKKTHLSNLTNSKKNKNPHLTMSNLADLVLAAEEPDLEDPMLQEELARLQARRAATPPVAASFSRPTSARPTSARPTSARVASQVEKPVAQRLGCDFCVTKRTPNKWKGDGKRSYPTRKAISNIFIINTILFTALLNDLS